MRHRGDKDTGGDLSRDQSPSLSRTTVGGHELTKEQRKERVRKMREKRQKAIRSLQAFRQNGNGVAHLVVHRALTDDMRWKHMLTVLSSLFVDISTLNHLGMRTLQLVCFLTTTDANVYTAGYTPLEVAIHYGDKQFPWLLPCNDAEDVTALMSHIMNLTFAHHGKGKSIAAIWRQWKAWRDTGKAKGLMRYND